MPTDDYIRQLLWNRSSVTNEHHSNMPDFTQFATSSHNKGANTYSHFTNPQYSHLQQAQDASTSLLKDYGGQLLQKF